MRLQRALTKRPTIARADAAHTAATDHLALSSKPCLPAPRRMKQADGCGPKGAQGGETGPARDEPGGGGEPQGVGDGEAPGADRVSPGRTTPCARDREPGGPGERPGGGVEPEQAETSKWAEEYERGKGNGFRIGSRARQGGTGGSG